MKRSRGRPPGPPQPDTRLRVFPCRACKCQGWVKNPKNPLVKLPCEVCGGNGRIVKRGG